MASRKILVPVDGSAGSLRALAFVARRQRENAAISVHVLLVQNPLPASRHVTRAMIADHHERMADEALQPVRSALARLKLDAEVHIRKGEPGQEIVDFARRKRCSEIVMGTRGLGRISGLLLGSVATKVVHLTPVPVTLVK